MPGEMRSRNGTHSPKIPLRRVDSDTCAVMVGQVIAGDTIINPGNPYYVHQGEWVEYLPVMSMGNMMDLMKTDWPSGDPAAPDTQQAMWARITARCEWLAQRLLAWNWTDLMGNPLPQPYQRLDVLMMLTNDELVWLISQSQSFESVAEQKNG